jgi:hypothetical protein
MLKIRYAILIVISITTSAERSVAYGPCDEDEAKFCAKDTHQETVRECLHKRMDQLSPECRDFVKTKESGWSKTQTSWDSVKNACQIDIKKHCKEMDPETLSKMKAVQVCLMSEGKNLQASCKKDLNRHIRDHQPNIKEIP